jgi:hypothetical protein
MPEPILVWCEGSGCPPASDWHRICSMCGIGKGVDLQGLVLPHERRDILAEIERGDFKEYGVPRKVRHIDGCND